MQAHSHAPLAAFGSGAVVGALGGLIGLGGAEFRLPLLLSLFRFPPLQAIVLNKATSLIVVAAALVFRTNSVPASLVVAQWPVIVNLLAGSLLGAWVGASWAARMHHTALYRIIALLLAAIAVVLFIPHDEGDARGVLLDGSARLLIGVLAGFGIGVVASLLGVAGGELLIPTLVLLFGIDIKVAGSVSLAISLPTMLVGFARYSRDESFAVLATHRSFALWLAIGSVAGVLLGAVMLQFTSGAVLHPLLAVILLLSAVKVWRHTP